MLSHVKFATKRFVSTFLILIVIQILSTAQVYAVTPSTAHWIWASTSSANQWVAFRKTINLSAAPSLAITQIAVDSKYWLYINGNLVVFEGGLKRGPTPTDTYYDEKNIASYLTSGNNTIALIAWYYGKQGESHNSSGQGGLLFQSDIVVGGNTTRLNSDDSWKAKQHSGYGANASGGQPYYTLSESNIYYDARNATSMLNWNTSGFVDSAWSAATDKGIAGTAPWNALVLRPIPFFRYTGLLDYTNAAPASGAGATPIVMNLPSNLQITPYLQINAPAGETIGIQTDHYSMAGQTTLRTTYITTGGVQEFESLGWVNGGNVQYTIPATVQIVALKYRESGYDTNITGSFASNDSFFNTLWKKAARTMYVTMRDNYMDCPDRERAQWGGDAVNEVKEGFYTFDTKSYALYNKLISQFTNWQKPSGVLYSPVPQQWSRPFELPIQSLASVSSFWTFYLYTGDSSVINTTYSRIKTYMNLWTLDANGLVNHRPGDWDWEDWGSNIDNRVLDNAWYYMALDSTIKLANMTGNTADMIGWQAKRNSIAANFNTVLWNGTNHEYRSPGYTGDTDDRGNAMAVVAGLADAAKYSAISDVLNVHKNASPYMEFYVLEAMYMMGNAESAEARMKSRYATQVSDPSYTLWEFWTKASGSDNHGWNGGPLYALSAYAAGVRPTSPGYTTYQVTPQIGGQTTINAVVPTIKGNIAVNLNKLSSTHFTLGVTSPAGTTATVGIPNIGMTNPAITANGTTVYTGGSATGSVSGLSYAGKDLNYVYFSVTSGTWNFDETGGVATSCASEGGTCSFNGVMQARYGADTSYFYKVVNNSIACTSAAFGGDPVYGKVKQCAYTAPVPTGGPSGYTACASENGTCSFSGTATVAFGAYGSFNDKVATTSIACNNVVFGDPILGVAKQCYYSLQPPNNGWTQCSSETGSCSFAGSRRVAYGANGAFFYRAATSSIACNSTIFGGDPASGTVKACYYK